MGSLWRLLTLLFVFLPWTSLAQDTTQGKVLPIQIRATPLFDGLVRSGESATVHLDAMNKGPEMRGTFVFKENHLNGDAVSRERTFSLPKNARKAWSFQYVPNWGTEQSILFRGLGEPLFVEYKVRPVADNAVVVGVIGFDAQGINVLAKGHRKYIPTAQPSQLGDLSEERDVRVGLVAKEMLPNRKEGYASLNWLVWPDADPSSLAPEQLDALLMWVATGGHLFLTVTDSSRQLMESRLAELLPATIDGMQDVSSIRGFTKALGQNRVKDVSIPIARLRPKEIAGRRVHTVATLKGDRPVWVVGSYGLGSVHMVPMNFRDPLVQNALDIEAMWRSLLWIPSPNASSPFRTHPSDLVSMLRLQHQPSTDIAVYGEDQERGLFDYLSDIPGVAPLPLSWLLAFAGVYLLCIGPIDYFVLKRLGRQPWTWVTFPTYIVVFSAVAMVGTSWSKGSQSVVKRLDVVDILPGVSVQRGTTNVGLFVTGRTEVVLSSSYPNSHVVNNGGFMENIRRVQGMGAETLQWGTQTWTLAYGRANWLNPSSSMKLEVTMDSEGTLRIENQTGHVLESCRGMIRNGNRMWVVGWVQPGETKEVSSTMFDTEPIDARYYDSDHPEEWAIVAALEDQFPIEGAPLAQAHQGSLGCTLSDWPMPLDIKGVSGRKESITVLRTSFEPHAAFLESK